MNGQIITYDLRRSMNNSITTELSSQLKLHEKDVRMIDYSADGE